jgi:hypothetical protein
LIHPNNVLNQVFAIQSLSKETTAVDLFTWNLSQLSVSSLLKIRRTSSFDFQKFIYRKQISNR